MTKYTAKVTGMGELAQELMDSGTLIIFDENAPAELAEISVLHTQASLQEDVLKGDVMTIGSKTYTVLDVGSEANHTLRDMGHCSFKFEGDTAELPGQICLDGEMPHIQIGDTLSISSR